MKKNLSLTEIMEAYDPMYPLLDEEATRAQRWKLAFGICRDEDGAIVDHLKDDFSRHRAFREPVFLSPGDNPFLENGTHRLTALYEMGLHDVPIAVTYTGSLFREGDPAVVLDFTVEHWLESDENTLMNAISDAVRSFPINERLWLNIEDAGFSKDNDILRTEFSGMLSLRDSSYVDEVREIVQEKMAAIPGFVTLRMRESTIILD